MLLIAIDYSFNSIGITFRTEENCRYVSIISKHTITSSKTKTNEDILSDGIFSLLSAIENVHIFIIDSNPISTPKNIGLQNWERLSMLKYKNLNTQVYRIIKNILRTYYLDISNIKIVFENYSYGSTTDNLIQMVESTHKLKDLLCFGGISENEILKPVISVENLYIAPGPEIKKLAGAGNFNKYDMMVSFSNNFSKDKVIENDKLRMLCNNNRSDITKNTKDGTELLKPLDDIIDSYFLSLWLNNIIKKILS